METYRRSLTVRCSLETSEVVARVKELIGWSEGKIAAHIIDRAAPLLRSACDEEDLMLIIRILRKGSFSVAMRSRSANDRHENQQPQ